MSSGEQGKADGSGSARLPYRRRRTRVASDKRIAEDEFMAAAIGDVEWLRQTLRDQKPGEVNFDKNGLSALHLSAIHGRLNCLKLLIEKYKFDINLPSSTGWRAIHLCISNQTGKRAIQCLEYLLEKKADASCSNDDGITPLHQAASEGHVQCLKMLIDYGAKIDGEDCREHTPLDLAKLWGHRRCARIIAAEMWQQGKDHVAKEMRQLKRLKMQQVLKEMELEAEYKIAHEQYSEKAFKEWLEKQDYDRDMPTGPKARQPETKKDTKKTGVTQKESLTKPNSVAAKTPGSTVTKKTDRRPDSIPTTKYPQDQSPISRHATNLTQVMEDYDSGIHEVSDVREPEPEKRVRSPSFVNPNRWKIPLKVDDPPYITNLKDDYPRDEYTMMPAVESAPKYYDGRHGPRLYKDDVKDDPSIDTKKKLRKPKLPKEIIDKVMSKDGTLDERPFLFKPRHIHDVHKKKLYGDDIKGKSEVSLHLCDDMSSFLFKNSLKSRANTFDVASAAGSNAGQDSRQSNSLLKAHTSTRSTSSSNWTSVKFPREQVINTLRTMGRPRAFPYLKGDEYDIGIGPLPT